MYEVYAPDETDEFYDELCDVAWAKMFSEGYDNEAFEFSEADSDYLCDC